MSVSISASGTPKQVAYAVTQQVASARKSDPALGTVALSLRDAMAAQLAGVAEDAVVTLSASASLTVTVKEPAPVVAEDAPAEKPAK